eukprot:751516-Hanusia_phi.AAC.1
MATQSESSRFDSRQKANTHARKQASKQARSEQASKQSRTFESDLSLCGEVDRTSNLSRVSCPALASSACSQCQTLLRPAPWSQPTPPLSSLPPPAPRAYLKVAHLQRRDGSWPA